MGYRGVARKFRGGAELFCRYRKFKVVGRGLGFFLKKKLWGNFNFGRGVEVCYTPVSLATNISRKKKFIFFPSKKVLCIHIIKVDKKAIDIVAVIKSERK